MGLVVHVCEFDWKQLIYRRREQKKMCEAWKEIRQFFVHIYVSLNQWFVV